MPKSKSCVLKARGRKGYRKITVLLSLFLFSALGSGLVFFFKALFPIRVDNLQQGAAFHFTKYAAFLDPPPHKAAEDKKGVGVGEGENFFSREKTERRHRSFPLPQEPSTLVGNKAFFKWHCPCPGVEIPSAFLKPGYFICRHGDGFFSEEIRNFNQKDKRFSHIGVLVPGKTGIQVVHADTQDHSGKAGVSVEKIEVFLSHAQRAGVFRFRQLDEKSVICHALSLAGRPFDWKFDLSDDSALYCTELIDCLYRQIAGKSPLKQRKLGKKNLIPIEACLDKELATEIYVSPPEKK